ncbi:uncharacterized protein LOC132048855 [Lycium ferocissimum]|uniref:uncharacterized protein LOC132048855 n=1 Tax=Lycium ferocissimum TaxID=112874 RepID=UPI00281572EA|nr:uncharacterized protein LOC132048855 [Lycium ferocissimum]
MRLLRFRMNLLHDDSNIAAQNEEMNITKIGAFVQGNVDRMKEEEARQKEKDKEFSKRAKSIGNFSDRGSQRGRGRQFFKNGSSGLTPSTTSAPIPRSRCGKRHPGECRMGIDVCFGCGQRGHYQRDCPSARKDTRGNVAQSINSGASNSQAQFRCAAAKSCNTGRGQNRLHALAGRQGTKARVDVVTDLEMRVFHGYVFRENEQIEGPFGIIFP